MKRLVAALAVVLSVLLASPAGASRPGVTPHSACVSGWEFNHLPIGTPRAAAERLLDGPGRGTHAGQRAYRSCANTWRQAQVVVHYVDGRVSLVAGVRVDAGQLLVPSAGGR